MLKKLPEEIGHLQKLTSLGLIGNKLEYLPIPLANLPNLRALWLTQNQSHPLVIFLLMILIYIICNVFFLDTITNGEIRFFRATSLNLFSITTNSIASRSTKNH